jgi:hypothetical protein
LAATSPIVVVPPSLDSSSLPPQLATSTIETIPRAIASAIQTQRFTLDPTAQRRERISPG